MEKLNWKELDSKIKPHNKQKKMAAVKKHGFKFISEFVFGMYYTQEKTTQELSKKLHVAKTTVLWWMQTWGFERRTQGPSNIDRQKRIADITKRALAIKGTCTAKQAATKLGCTPAYVNNIWREANYVMIKCTKCGEIFRTLSEYRGVIGVKSTRCKKCQNTVGRNTRLAQSQKIKLNEDGRVTCKLSTWKTRGISREVAEKNRREFDFMSWKEHKGEIPKPLPRWMLRLGSYTNI